MPEPTDKVDLVRSMSSGVAGRTLNSARTNHFVLDSPSGPGEAVTNGEAFLAGISSCGVTLIEHYAHDNGIPLSRMSCEIEGIRRPPVMNSFHAINVRFTLEGTSQENAASRVGVWQEN